MDKKFINEHKYYNNKLFNRLAWLYDFEKYILFPIRKKAVDFLGNKPRLKIIDVATGTGAQAYELAKAGYDVVGIDLSEEMLKYANEKVDRSLKLKFLKADATDLPFRNNSFEAASISLGLHDMPFEIGIKALKEMKRVTKNGGAILIIDYMEPSKHRIAKYTYRVATIFETKNFRPFIKKGLDKYLKTVGMKVKKQTDVLGAVQIVIAVNKK